MIKNDVRRLLRRTQANLRFHDEDAARSHIDVVVRRVRPRCPLCRRVAKWPPNASPAKGRCVEHGWFSYRQGTILEKSHLPLRHWLAAIRLAVASRGLVTPAELHRALDLRSFHTAQRLANMVCDEWTSFDEARRDVWMSDAQSGDVARPSWVDDAGATQLEIDDRSGDWSQSDGHVYEALEACAGTSNFGKVAKGRRRNTDDLSWFDDADVTEDQPEDLAPEAIQRTASLRIEDTDEVSSDEIGMPLDCDEIDEMVLGSGPLAMSLNGGSFLSAVDALFAYEYVRVSRFKLESLKSANGMGRGDFVSCTEAAAILGLSIKQMIALSRLSDVSAFAAVRDDRVVFLRRTLEAGRELFRRFATHSPSDLSRVSPKPLPPLLWKQLKKLRIPSGRGRQVADQRYEYLAAFWREVDCAYRNDEAPGGGWRRSRRGLRWALIETTDLSLDRCHRYAAAIELVNNTPAYDGSSRAFAEILSSRGGLDRATRSAGTKRKKMRVNPSGGLLSKVPGKARHERVRRRAPPS